MIQTTEATIRIEGLISRAKKGEREAFTTLYYEYFKPIYRYIHMRVGEFEQAEDLAQEVFLKALEGIGSYRYEGVPFGSWLFRIAHNVVIDHYRRSNKSFALDVEPLSGMTDDPVKTVEEHMESMAIQKAIDTLPPRQREVISLRFGAGMSIAETAKATRTTAGTVKKLQFEALAKVRKLVGNEQEI